MGEGGRLVYHPSAPHKTTTTEAGPPVWNPYKEKCPPQLTTRESQRILETSHAEGDDPLEPRRWAVHRSELGTEFFESKFTERRADGSVVVHGYPTARVPPKVLRKMRDAGDLTQAEYNRFRKELG
jgi:hypothetical protein